MSRILITGAGGQVGAELARQRWPANVEPVALTRAELDITDSVAVSAALALHKPDLIVNAAAYTAVDRAETEPEQANLINHVAVRQLAERAHELHIGMIHLSTDYVFDGQAGRPYSESDSTNPTGVYGASKLAGEEPVLESGGMVLRTSWVFGALGPNFVRTMRRLAFERETVNVVCDQFGCPTAAVDIAAAIAQIATHERKAEGLYHLAAPDSASWWDLAVAAIAGLDPQPDVEILKISTAEFPTAAKRPKDSRLNCDKLFNTYGIRLRLWAEALGEVSEELNAQRLGRA